MTLFIGIDPGLSGAIAFYDLESGRLAVDDMPTVEIKRNGKDKKEINPHVLADFFTGISVPCSAVLERVGAMPGQGVTSVFSFGRSVGVIEGVLAASFIKVTIVTPQTWQKAAGVRGGKDGARLRASELFPAYAGMFSRKKDDGRADATLMAWYAATK